MKSIFEALSHNIHRHAKLWITAILAITLVLGFGLPKIQMKMGNDVFVNKHAQISKDTDTYQKNFGGNSIYILLSGDQADLLKPANLKKVADLDSHLQHVDNVRSTTNVVNAMNEQLSSTGGTSNMTVSADTQNQMLKNLTAKQKATLQTRIQKQLTTQQQAQVQRFTLSQLTATQKQAMAQGQSLPAAQQQAALQKALSKSQQTAIAKYTMSLLKPKQQQVLAAQIKQDLPPLQSMSPALIKALVLSDHGKVPSQLNALLPKDGKHLLISVNTGDKADMGTYVKMTKDIKKAINQTGFSSQLKVRVGGQPTILGQIQNLVLSNMVIMMGLAVVLMVIILLLIFPVRRRLLALLFVSVSLIWTFGLMGWLGLPLTLATMATLPIIIGLGTDFGVQFHNRYEEEYRKQGNAQAALTTAITHMGPAVGVALIVMSLSFLTMFLSKAPMMQQFGLTLAIGVVSAYLSEFGLMFSTLALLDRPKENATVQAPVAQKPSRLSKGLTRYAKFVTRHAWPIVIIGILLGGLGFGVERQIGTETDIAKMIPQNMSALKNTNYLQDQVGSTSYITYLVKADDVRDKANLTKMRTLENQVVSHETDVLSATSLASVYHQMDGSFDQSQPTINQNVTNLPQTLKTTVISDNHQYATIQFKMKKDMSSQEALALMNRVTNRIGGQHGSLTIHAAGSTDMGLIGVHNMTANHWLIIFAGLAIIFLVLLLVYRNWHLAIYPIVPILLVLGLSPLTLWALHISYNPVTVALSSLVLGIGTEFTILILERYREEELAGVDSSTAIVKAIGSVGQAITVSGLTVVGGFSAIMFASFPMLKSFGLITVLDTGYSLISALTILPAMIHIVKTTGRKRRVKSGESNRSGIKWPY